jgi:hypothetical protein
MTLAQFAIARVAANLERNADGLTAGEAQLLVKVLAPAVARYGAAESSDCPPAKGERLLTGEVGRRSPARQFGGWYPC